MKALTFEYAKFLLNSGNKEDKKGFYKFRREDALHQFQWLFMWIAGAAVTMLLFALVVRTQKRFVILAFEIVVAILAGLIQYFKSRFEEKLQVFIIAAYFIFYQVFTVWSYEMLSQWYEEIYIEAYIARVYVVYVITANGISPSLKQ